MDLPTSNKIAQLHPSVRNEVQKIINECDKALTGRAKVRISQNAICKRKYLFGCMRSKAQRKSNKIIYSTKIQKKLLWKTH